MSSSRRVLVAGIGNVFHGDDGFGVAVAASLRGRPLPDGVEVVDFGIRGYDLALALADGYDAAILVDAVRRGEPPGAVVLVEPELEGLEAGTTAGGHGMNPVEVLKLAKQLGGAPPSLYLVGCEPGRLADDEGEMGLSPAVERAVAEAAGAVEELARRLALRVEV